MINELLLCNDNMQKTSEYIGINNDNLNKFKFQSKTYYLKLKHYYSHVE